MLRLVRQLAAYFSRTAALFALMGTELVEGRVFDGGIAEIQRVGMTGPPRYRR